MKDTLKEYELQFIKGVGPKKATILAEFGITSFYEMILNFPKSYIYKGSLLSINNLFDLLNKQDYIFKSDHDNINSLKISQEYSILAKVIEKREVNLRRGRKLLTIIVSDNSGRNAKINFWSYTDFYKSKYKLGDTLSISGKASLNSSFPEFSHPDIETIGNIEVENINKGQIIPRYQSTEKFVKSGISQDLLRKIAKTALNNELQQFDETLPKKLVKTLNFPNLQDAISTLHFPENFASLEKAQKRMKFEEIFYYILKVKVGSTDNVEIQESPIIKGKSELARNVYNNLNFKLTGDQKNVLNEISNDLETNKPMNRLLQGDVGSGKTIVALLSILMVVDKGYQTLFMAPTELLAEQHFSNFLNLTEKFGVKTTLLTGSKKGKERNGILEHIKNGKSQIIIGTHALFQKKLEYHKLAFIVIDEQHRFGVAQRSNLMNLAENSFNSNDLKLSPNILVMSATPIPRTLSMTIYSNLKTSIIKEKPPGRTPIITSIAFESRLKEVWSFIKNEIRKGKQAYIVFPLVEKSEKLDLKSAEEQFSLLSNMVFKGIKTDLLHGRLKSDEKEAIMSSFQAKKTKILFATSVIEVGIDIPNATVMVIMEAQRFGLAQLHQLRGRVGRSTNQSFCILVTKDKYEFEIKRGLDKDSEKLSAIKRLKTMEGTEDGFKIAEADLEIRGPGDMTGTMQSGLPAFKFINLIYDKEVIKDAKELADRLTNGEALFSKKDNNRIKEVLKGLLEKKSNYIGIA